MKRNPSNYTLGLLCQVRKGYMLTNRAQTVAVGFAMHCRKPDVFLDLGANEL